MCTYAYLLSVLRYIHRNPVKAGMVQNMADYPYSSYQEYLKPKAGQLTPTSWQASFMLYIDNPSLKSIYPLDR